MRTSRLLSCITILIVIMGIQNVSGQWGYNGTHIYNTNSGYVGIGSNTPGSLLYVAKNTIEPTVTVRNNGGTGGATYSMIDDVSGANWKFKATALGGFKIRDHANSLDVITLEPATGNVGIGTGTPGAKLEVYSGSDYFVRLGQPSSVKRNYFYNRELAADGDGQAAIYTNRTRDVQNDGTSYASTGVNCSNMSYNAWGDLYSFGTAGFSYFDYGRCGGVLGAHWTGIEWGALGYRSSGSTSYGGYFTTYTSGAGKAGQQALIGIGIGAWGDLFGADIHGKLYGVYAEGEHYAMFSNGTVYKNDLDVHLQDNGSGKNTALYTYVSTDVCVQTSGTATLSSGSANIQFDPAFTSIVSASEPVVVTVTPIGECNGIHLNSVSASGFTVAENNAGKSNITVNYIAIGKRTGYENPSLPAEVVDANYTTKLARGLHADSDLQTNGEGLYYENGQLVVGIHPSTIEDHGVRQEEEIKPPVK